MISLKVLIVYGKFKSTITIDYSKDQFETEDDGIQNEDKNLDSDEGIILDSGRGTKIFLNRLPSDSYVVEIVGEKNSKMKHPSENIGFIQNIDGVIALVSKTLGKSFSVIEY